MQRFFCCHNSPPVPQSHRQRHHRSSSLSHILPISLPCVVFLLLLLSSLQCPVRAVLNKYLQAGWSPNSSEVILNGEPRTASFSTAYPTWQPFPTFYLWLSPNSSTVSPLSYQVLVDEGSPYIPSIGPAPWLAVNDQNFFSVYAIDDPEVEEQAVVVSTGGLCDVQWNNAGQSGKFYVNTAANFDDVEILFKHDCFYPPVRVGQPPATDDVIAYSTGPDPNLTPKAGVRLSVTANVGEQLVLDVRVVDIGVNQWPHGQNATFILTINASNDALLQTTIVTPEIGVPQYVIIGEPLLDELPPAQITVASTCTDPASSGYIVLSLNFGFARPMTLPVNITCQAQKSVNPLRSFSVDLMPGAQFVGVTGRLPIAVNGTVPVGSAFSVQPSAGGPYTFAMPQRYVVLSVYNANYVNQNLTGRLTVNAGSWLVGLTASSSATTTPGSNALTFALRGNRLTVQIETVCQDEQQQQTTSVLIDSITDGVDFYYDPIEFNYQWTCRQPPLFALSTQPATSPQSTGLLINQGQPANTASGDWTVSTKGGAGVINVDYNIQAEYESVVGATLYLTLQSNYSTMFAWSLDTDSSYGLSGASFRMAGLKLQSGMTYKTNLPLSYSTQLITRLELDSLVCSKREYVQVSTRLTYGWERYVTIEYNRHCDQADQLTDAPSLSEGAVAAIVLFVLATACCVMGCGWRYSSKGKRGWEMLPFYDVWGRVQDSALGPKRYTGPQMMDEDLDGMTEEVEISSTGGGGYGSTSYQNDL